MPTGKKKIKLKPHWKSQFYWDKMNKNLGSVPPARPDDIKLSFPHDISNVSAKKLGFLYSKYTKLQSFYLSRLSMAEMDFASTKSRYKFLRSKYLLLARGRTISERKAFVTTRPKVRLSEQTMMEAKALYVMLRSYSLICDKYIACVSREITRREKDWKGHANFRD